MSNYFNDVLAQILFDMRYPEGTTKREKVDGEWMDVPIDPLYLGPNQRNEARSQASLSEDEMLRGLLGSSRARRRNEPEGSYTTVRYPGIDAALWSAESGFGAPGFGTAYTRMTPEQQKEWERKNKQWAARQREILGMGQPFANAHDFMAWNERRRGRRW